MYVPLHVLCGIMTFAYCSLQYSTIQCLFASNAQLTNPHSWTLVFLSKRLQATAGNRALARSPPRPVMTLPTTSFPCRQWALYSSTLQSRPLAELHAFLAPQWRLFQREGR
ncbi:hypothetical protein B0J15DRAFT_477225 [Fusarium solani]|uniref:Uncharacterized protein n=1 Tax=Fusarium solani TaxID=169388 RepID=A0A9P9RCX5_FUSSL|nr:uncharacterized protein B0J15DRAFT_477225 [Fusarium solani]KAH7273475.1 hypothetical protein B0J15DRAFT_477225 [Fusarium solani]